MQRQGVEVRIVDRLQIKTLVRTADPHVPERPIGAPLQSLGKPAQLERLQLLRARQRDQLLCNDTGHSWNLALDEPCLGTDGLPDISVTFFEQRGLAPLCQLRELPPQTHGILCAAADRCIRLVTQQLPGLGIIEKQQQGVDQVGIRQLVHRERDRFVIDPDGVQHSSIGPLELNRSAGPQAVQQLKLPERVGLQIILCTGAADVLDEGVDIPVDPEPGHRIAEQRDRPLVIGVHAYQRTDIGTADSANVAELVGQPLHRRTESLDQRIGIPGVRCFTLDYKSAGAVTLRHRLIGLGTGRMLNPVFAGLRIELEFEMIIVQRQNLPALMLMQTVKVRFGIRRQTQVLLQVRLQIFPP
ncbi:hypothetical protein D3C72_656230 [compost metagenome]